ncbi:hypothetical protein [Sphingomonas xinjiangensis]|uniref:Lipoprotein n=1 Tax=Sphingomonas xinjiangensis TaxID=643568 RepID=A0A840YSR2_9SPHN|nr:hypothetical protein [Sphingomonas xinjiangensis]MBB5712707.1 hypothetical protein [Sphingomonas xinjiangensis]
MRRAISWLLVAGSLFSSCNAGGVTEGRDQRAASPLMMQGKAGVERPLAPSILEFRHVESRESGGSSRTFIQTLGGDRWVRTFGNVTFGWADPYVVGLIGESSTPGIVVRGQLERLEPGRAVLNAIREYGADLAVPGLGPTGRAYVFLFPKRVDFDQTLALTRTESIEGLERFATLTPQCSYARLHLDHGIRQAAILLLHVPDLTVSLDDPQDSACVEQFFARNLLLSRTQVQSLLYPAGARESGRCVLARVLRPSNGRREPSPEQSACPEAPIRRAEVLSAYAAASGVGLQSDAARKAIESIKKVCSQQVTSGEVKDESCRALLNGEN